MGLFDFLKAPRLDHPRFGEMKLSGGFWRGESDYLGTKAVRLKLRGSKKGIDPAAQTMCDELEARYPVLTDRIGAVLHEESYRPVREAIDSGDYPEENDDEIPVIETPADVWNHLRLRWIVFGADHKADRIEIAYYADWEVEHTLGIYLEDWKVDEFNGSLGPF